MYQRDIDQAGARATQESLSVVRHYGFQIEQSSPDDPDLPIDWDAIQLERNVQLVRHSLRSSRQPVCYA